MRRTLGSLAVAACLLAMPGTLAAQGADEHDIDPIARQRFQIAAELYARGQFAEAAAEFQRVYDATQHPDVLHNIYVAHRDAGNKRDAAAALRAYVESGAEIPDRAVMEGRLATLEREIAEEDARNAEPQPTPVEPAPPAVEPDPDPVTAPAPAPDEGPSLLAPAVVLGAGVAITIGGVVVGVIAMGQYATLEEECNALGVCRAERQDDIDSLGTTALVADILMIGGGAIAVAGALWLVLAVTGDDSETLTALAPWVTTTSAGAALGGSF